MSLAAEAPKANVEIKKTATNTTAENTKTFFFIGKPPKIFVSFLNNNCKYLEMSILAFIVNKCDFKMIL